MVDGRFSGVRRRGIHGVGYTSKFQEFIWTMNRRKRQAYAERAGTTLAYLETHLSSGRKTPGRALMHSLVVAAHGRVSMRMLLDHFYPDGNHDENSQ